MNKLVWRQLSYGYCADVYGPRGVYNDIPTTTAYNFATIVLPRMATPLTIPPISGAGEKCRLVLRDDPYTYRVFDTVDEAKSFAESVFALEDT